MQHAKPQPSQTLVQPAPVFQGVPQKLPIKVEGSFDMRQASVTQRRYQEQANSSLAVQKLRTLQGIMNRQAVMQLKTDITHTSGEAEFKGVKGNVGLNTDAYLDPHQPVRGSVPQGDLTPIYEKFSEANPGSAWARGHLLNHDLGGKGIPENLYPITREANGTHSALVEQPIKNALADLKRLNETKSEEKRGRVHYEVNVLGTPDDAIFDCQWDVDGGEKNVIDEQVSTPRGREFIYSKSGDGKALITGMKGEVLSDWNHKGGDDHKHETDVDMEARSETMEYQNGAVVKVGGGGKVKDFPFAGDDKDEKISELVEGNKKKIKDKGYARRDEDWSNEEWASNAEVEGVVRASKALGNVLHEWVRKGGVHGDLANQFRFDLTNDLNKVADGDADVWSDTYESAIEVYKVYLIDEYLK